MTGTFLYLHGFASGPSSFKARYFSRRFAELGIRLIVPALDEGDFEHLTVTRQRVLIERLTGGAPSPLVIIGSSLGGYLAALHASAHPVDALVVMAPAVDYARRLETRSGQEFERWRQTGFVEVDHYGTGRRERLSFDLIRDAPNHEPFPGVSAPALVLQGRTDEVVPLAIVESWVKQQPNAKLVVYDSGHELTAVVDAMWEATVAFLRGTLTM
jgi:pimeloyl-ACP methyl ester carboxylesterase